jgi:hypothetical protein
MAMTTVERSQRANAVKTAKAKRRRWVRVLQEMRDAGLVVHVREEDAQGEFDTPQWSEPEATFTAVYR